MSEPPATRAGRLFDETARDHDRIGTWMSFGTSAVYRRWVLAGAGLVPGMPGGPGR